MVLIFDCKQHYAALKEASLAPMSTKRLIRLRESFTAYGTVFSRLWRFYKFVSLRWWRLVTSCARYLAWIIEKDSKLLVAES